MDNPGFTIFQGDENIKIDTSLNRLEEEEALEDQKRRDEELGNQLQNAFDDLIDDDEDCTVDSSIHMVHKLQTSLKLNNKSDIAEQQRIKQQENHNHDICTDKIKKYEKIIESKSREIENISKMVIEEQKRIEDLKKSLSLSEAEKERAFMQKQQTHELLVESKTQISELEDSILKFKTKIKNLEDVNNNLVGELERTKTLLLDYQHKYHLVEKNIGLNAQDRQASDTLLKQVNERHIAQVQMMQHQINNLNQKLNDKENEYRTLETKYRELQRSHETLLIENTKTISQLTHSLEDSQRQCQQFAAKQDFAQENLRLQRLVRSLERQTEDMQKQINILTAHLESTTAELELMDSVLSENDSDNSKFSINRQNATTATTATDHHHLISQSSLTVTDRLIKLKNELYRLIASQKNKREQIRQLQDQLTSKNQEVKKLKDDENKALIEIETLKEDKLRFENKIRIIESELNELKMKKINKSIAEEDFTKNLSELKDKNEMLNTELKQLQNECTILRMNCTKYEKENEEIKSKLKFYKDLENENENLKMKLEILGSGFDKMRKEYERYKMNEVNYHIKENTEVSNVQMNDEIRKSNNMCNEVFKAKEKTSDVGINTDTKTQNTQIEFIRIKDKCCQLEEALKLSEMKCDELCKMLDNQKIIYEKEINNIRVQLEKEKANIENLKEFRNPINESNDKDNNDSSSGISSSLSKESQKLRKDQSVETSPELIKNTRQFESEIRTEMAKMYAYEIKRIENNYHLNMKLLDGQNIELKQHLDNIKSELIQKQNEIEILKHVIITERDKAQDILKSSKNESKEILDKNTVMLNKCRKELKLKTEKIDKLTKKLNELKKQTDLERQSLNIVIKQWEEKDKKNKEEIIKWQELEEKHKNIVEQLQLKINSAKKTASNYKKYAEDKEKFMLDEYERVKSKYEASLLEIERKMKEILEKDKKPCTGNERKL